MADSEKSNKYGKFRQFWKSYQNDLFTVVIVVFVYAMLTDHDIMDYLELLQKRPASGILLLVLLLLAAGGLHVLKVLWQNREKQE